MDISEDRRTFMEHWVPDGVRRLPAVDVKQMTMADRAFLTSFPSVRGEDGGWLFPDNFGPVAEMAAKDFSLHDSAKAVYLSHLRAIEAVSFRPPGWYLIMEDDIWVNITEAERLISTLPADADIFKLQSLCFAPWCPLPCDMSTYKNKICKVDRSAYKYALMGSAAYLFNHRGNRTDSILAALMTLPGGHPSPMMHLISERFNIFVLDAFFPGHCGNAYRFARVPSIVHKMVGTAIMGTEVCTIGIDDLTLTLMSLSTRHLERIGGSLLSSFVTNGFPVMLLAFATMMTMFRFARRQAVHFL